MYQSKFLKPLNFSPKTIRKKNDWFQEIDTSAKRGRTLSGTIYICQKAKCNPTFLSHNFVLFHCALKVSGVKHKNQRKKTEKEEQEN